MTPSVFKKWAGIFGVSAALERRCYVRNKMGPVYPNLYVLLLSPPGVGKSAVIQPLKRLWKETSQLHVAPSNLTTAGLFDEIAEASQDRIVDGTTPIKYHSLIAASSELGVFMPAYDMHFISMLTDLWDCDDEMSEGRRGRGKTVIKNPQFSLLAGTQPGYLSQFLPPAAWEQGFMARVICVYCDEGQKIDLFGDSSADDELWASLVHDMKEIVTMQGEFKWSRDAKAIFSQWVLDGTEPKPRHFKLTHYNTRRHMQAMKLAQVASAARDNTLKITGDDASTALNWLFEAEEAMGEIFKALSSHTDGDLIREFQMFVAEQYATTKKPITRSKLITFLSTKLPVQHTMRMFELAVQSEIIKETKITGTFVPGGGDVDTKIDL